MTNDQTRYRVELAMAALEGFMGWAAEREPVIEAREQAYQREIKRARHVEPIYRGNERRRPAA